MDATKLSYELINRFDKRVPRYTSYPTVPNWTEKFGPKDYISDLVTRSEFEDPLSIYVHIPFCIRRCLFCACTVLVTQRVDRPEKYLEYLKLEIDKTRDLLNSRDDVIQLHFGGGTPTHLTPEQLDDLLGHIYDRFSMNGNAEKSIELHPSVTSIEHMEVLKTYGFNRVSMGVQDFDLNVQEKLNRFQTYEETKLILDFARSNNFDGVNMDLIYGLPYQTTEGFEDTIDKTLILKPDRIALYSYAHLPNIIRHQSTIPLDVIPTGPNKLDLFLYAREKFLEDGYVPIGFDHFALPDDEISISVHEKTLRRNFMGFTTKAGTDMIAFGYSGISELHTAYAQNSKDMGEYETMIEKYGVATIKGYKLSDEDILRKQVIMDWLCLNEIDYTVLKEKYGSNSKKLIKISEDLFPNFQEIDFVEKTDNGWKATSMGRLFARVIASSFDEYYDASKHLFSRSV
ncbi:MAG: Oxygen-independent coproporphyrinogen-III oxidase [Candidatus Heimdallarchaeota archaeon LC_2]|nr:MAG: Oxygen-independent coproporphyrinogen-III oxidase [Candidatus Heimdallarchaeota archaeon LC_2]